MKTKQCAFLLAAIVALVAIAIPLRASDTDDRIVSSAQDSYIWKTYLKGDDIQIESKDGAVALTGEVAEGFHRSLAETTVESLPGVKSVNNQLTIKGTKTSPSQDMLVAGKVKASLWFHRYTSAVKTEVSVNEGKVTLRGDADSQAQRDLAGEYAKDVDGVKDVDNQMTVSSAPTIAEKMSDSAGKMADSIDDASITVQVKYALLVHRSTGAIKTNVDTENGVVTLQGKAKNDTEKALVTKLVTDINGVKSVQNKMTIE